MMETGIFMAPDETAATIADYGGEINIRTEYLRFHQDSFAIITTTPTKFGNDSMSISSAFLPPLALKMVVVLLR